MSRTAITLEFPEGVGQRLALELTVEALIRMLDALDADDEREADEDHEDGHDAEAIDEREPDEADASFEYDLDQTAHLHRSATMPDVAGLIQPNARHP